MPDTSSDFDGIPLRKTLDKTINQHGQEFCEFLIDAKMCVLNGRFDSTNNGYTIIRLWQRKRCSGLYMHTA